MFQSTKKFFELPIEIRASIGIENSRHFRESHSIVIIQARDWSIRWERRGDRE